MLESKAKPSFELPEAIRGQRAGARDFGPYTLSFHHGKHHAGYVTKLNQLVEGSIYAGRPLDEVVKKSAEDPKKSGVAPEMGQRRPPLQPDLPNRDWTLKRKV